MALEPPASDRKLVISLSVLNDRAVCIEFSRPVTVIVVNPEFAMQIGRELKRKAAIAMEHPPAVEGT